jgi:CheY-like chemotaxis protein
MTETSRQLLIVSERQWVEERLRGLLPGFSHRLAPSSEAAIQQVEEGSVDLVVIDYTGHDAGFGQLLAAVRRRDSPSRQAAVVVLCEEETLEDAEAAFGRGAMRILNPRAADERLRTAFKELLEHAPRLPLRAVVKLTPVDAPARLRIISQTDNLSLSGMLVRYDKAVPIGGRLSFDLELPGQAQAIRGVAAVVRLTYNPQEDVTGFAVRFVSLEGDGRRRLDLALERLAPPSPAAKPAE